jgi:hypothetical protein
LILLDRGLENSFERGHSKLCKDDHESFAKDFSVRPIGADISNGIAQSHDVTPLRSIEEFV